jgi:hypothetical protein
MLLVIIANNLIDMQGERIVCVIRDHKIAIGCTPTDFKGISPFTCMHHILLEEKSKSTRKMQCLNHPMMEEVKAQILNLKVFVSRLIQPIRVDPEDVPLMIQKIGNNESDENG